MQRGGFPKKQAKRKKNQSSEEKENLHSDKSLETLDHIVSMPLKNISGILARNWKVMPLNSKTYL